MGWLSSVKEFFETNWERPYRVATGLLGLLLLFSWFARPLVTLAQVLAWAGADTWSTGVQTANAWMVAHSDVALSIAGQKVPLLELVVTFGIAACVAFAGRSAPPTREGDTFWLLVGLATYTTLSPVGLAIWAAGWLVIRAIVIARDQDFFDTIGAAAVDLVAGALWIPFVIAVWPFLRRKRTS